jgi:two-component system chemotaxis response regulator CheB
LTPGQVLVARPGVHLLAAIDGTLATIPAGDVPPYRPSADLLLATLAVVARPRVIAVVLGAAVVAEALSHRCHFPQPNRTAPR